MEREDLIFNKKDAEVYIKYWTVRYRESKWCNIRSRTLPIYDEKYAAEFAKAKKGVVIPHWGIGRAQ